MENMKPMSLYLQIKRNVDEEINHERYPGAALEIRFHMKSKEPQQQISGTFSLIKKVCFESIFWKITKNTG